MWLEISDFRACRLALCVLFAMVLSSCSAGLIRPRVTQAPMIASGPDHFRYVDYDLEIEFHQLSQQFSWRFKNHSMVDLVLDHAQVALRVEGDPREYTLWGELKEKQPNLPVITIKPNRFFETTYPVQFRSPFYPFKTEPAKTLELTVLWKGRPASYKLVFPQAALEDAAPESPDK